MESLSIAKKMFLLKMSKWKKKKKKGVLVCISKKCVTGGCLCVEGVIRLYLVVTEKGGGK